VTQAGKEGAEDWRSDAEAKSEEGLRGIDLRRSRETGRGREATTPHEIPALGWKDVFWRVLWAIPADRVLSTSGGVAFFALLAIFPAIGTVVSLYGLFADARTVATHVTLLAGILPGGVLQLIADQVTRIASQSSDTLGLAFLIGLAIALWSANSGMAALFDALNVVYGEKEKRSILRFYGTTFLFTLGAIAFVLSAISGVIVLPILLKFFGSETTAEQLLAVARWPFLLLVVMFALACVYRWGPSRNDAKWRWVSWGSVVAALLWVAASMLFSWYVVNFDSYNRTYGSLGAGIGFMTWIWLSAVIVLLGGELNAEMEHQTAQDTTEGRPKPLGTRGAHMADHVGAAQD
jgi:membrane protein